MERMDTQEYEDFLKRKVVTAPRRGFLVAEDEVNPLLKPHQRDAVRWAVLGGRRALFEAFGLGKTFQQLECVRLTLKNAGGRGLITVPLGVRAEFFHDAAKLGIPISFVRRIEECGPTGIYLTNYETVRDGKLDPRHFTVSSLDEASCLRGFGGTKTFREFMRLFAGDDHTGVRTEGVPFRYVATATPSPNEYIELLAYAAYLDIMDVSQAKTRFFKRDSTKADNLIIHPHKIKEFWLWVASWALFLQKPSDLGYSDDGYSLPPLDVRWHELRSDHSTAGCEKDGQGRLFANAAIGVTEAAREKKLSRGARTERAVEIINQSPDDHFIIWHDLEVERHEIKKALPEATEIYGSQDLELREKYVNEFSNGQRKYLATKPRLSGSGCNLQRHCHRQIFLGVGYKFNDFIQAIHRTYRFMQPHQVRIDIIYTEAEGEIKRALETKWKQHNEMVTQMSKIIREYGLADLDISKALGRAMGVERVEVSGESFKIVHTDCVVETRTMKSNSVGLVLTSIPFSTQYEYSPNFADFGHTDSNDHFWSQMDFLIPELLRVLQPGRIAAIHVKDRIVPGGMTGLGFQTVYPLHMETHSAFKKHGFAYMGMKTIVTDVVRENSQTYRLGWSEQCKDGSKMGVGMPEYLMLFRKPPTENANSYADCPVEKSKTDYTRSRWQVDAHGFTRSSGNRGISLTDFDGIAHKYIFRRFREWGMTNVYDFEHHVKIGEHIDAKGMLPVTFMLLQPPSWHPDVWTDITRMLTLNNAQSAKGKEMHLCPMQIDLADRAITQWTNPGDIVYDPFGGLMTVPYRAILLRRFGMACELSKPYFLDGASYCRAAQEKVNMPSLFDLVDDMAEDDFMPPEMEQEK